MVKQLRYQDKLWNVVAVIFPHRIWIECSTFSIRIKQIKGC